MSQWTSRGATSADELMLWCVGGPWMVRRVSSPPPIEIQCDRGMYVLNDDAANPADWHYVYVD